MDGRRLGIRPALLQGFLAAAAPGYLADADWDQIEEDWLEQALAWAARSCKGVRGPLTRIKPRPCSTGNHSPDPASGTAYQLADYLHQHGRRTPVRSDTPCRLLGGRRARRPR